MYFYAVKTTNRNVYRYEMYENSFKALTSKLQK